MISFLSKHSIIMLLIFFFIITVPSANAIHLTIDVIDDKTGDKVVGATVSVDKSPHVSGDSWNVCFTERNRSTYGNCQFDLNSPGSYIYAVIPPRNTSYGFKTDTIDIGDNGLSIVVPLTKSIAQTPISTSNSNSDSNDRGFLETAFANSFVGGLNNILESLTNQAYEMFGVNYSTAYTASIMTSPNNFIDNIEVQKQKNYTAFWFFFFYIIFMLAGAVFVMKEYTETNQGFGGKQNSWRNTYLTMAIGLPLVWALYLPGLNWFFQLEFVMSKGMFLQTFDAIPPTTNSLAYAIFGIQKLILILFEAYRYIIIGIIVSFFLLIVAAYIFPWTRWAAELILTYGAVLLFGRFIIVAVLSVAVGLLNDMGNSIGGLQNVLVNAYFIALLLDALIAIAIILYPIYYILLSPSMRSVSYLAGKVV